MLAESLGDWAEKQRFLGSSPNADKTRKVICCQGDVPDQGTFKQGTKPSKCSHNMLEEL